MTTVHHCEQSNCEHIELHRPHPVSDPLCRELQVGGLGASGGEDELVGGCTSSGKCGWNGGGEEGMNGGASCGGSSDISLFEEDRSDKWYNDEHIYSRIIVAGGGGGSASSSRPD
ncbi:hypothetical protein M9Y10_015403 [Tritrichomonas musculus]|uniref:receptor protein-tyrosine kinase n=1 Tax=Tritrichomonas musculus TaxID=1915356 RepID=A0ABR2L2B8_9EUKA